MSGLLNEPSGEIVPTAIRRFLLNRTEDETGISGVGVVAEGVMFSDGTAVMRWVSALRSTAMYSSMDELEAIHGHAGRTTVMWVDAP